MDQILRGLQRKWESTGSAIDGTAYLLAQLRVQPIDLSEFPINVLNAAKLSISRDDRKSFNFRAANLLYRRPITEVQGEIQEQIQPYYERLQPAPGPDGAVPAYDRLAHWFAEQNLPEEQAAASQAIVAEEYDDDDGDWYGYGGNPEYDSEEHFYDLVVWYPQVPCSDHAQCSEHRAEIRVFVGSQYADNIGDIRADFSSGFAEVPENIPPPMDVLREFIFWQEDGRWQLRGINIIAHGAGVLQSKLESIKVLIETSEWHLHSNYYPLPLLGRREHFILYDELTPQLLSGFNEEPTILRGSCEDYPACGHDRCPPRWSHTLRQAGMICAVCGGEMPLGGSSIHPACFRRSSAYDDPYGDGWYDDGFEGEFDEEEDEEDDDY